MESYFKWSFISNGVSFRTEFHFEHRFILNGVLIKCKLICEQKNYAKIIMVIPYCKSKTNYFLKTSYFFDKKNFLIKK